MNNIKHNNGVNEGVKSTSQKANSQKRIANSQILSLPETKNQLKIFNFDLRYR